MSNTPKCDTNDIRPVLLVTGGGRGIGAAASTMAAKRGYSVVVNYASNAESAERVVAQIQDEGGQATAIQADVGDPTQVQRLFNEIDDREGTLSGLVNNAGITGGFAKLQDLKTETLQEVVNINIVGAMLCAREAVRRMAISNGGVGGSIVNVSSRASKIGGGGEWIHYAMTKGAIDTLTLGLAKETADDGIRVNAVAPGLIETDLHAAAGAPDRTTRFASGIPMGRAGTADEIASGILWLLSDEASYITGTTIDIAGGR